MNSSSTVILFPRTIEKLETLIRILKCVECQKLLTNKGYCYLVCGHLVCCQCSKNQKECKCSSCGVVSKKQVWQSDDMTKMIELCSKLCSILQVKISAAISIESPKATVCKKVESVKPESTITPLRKTIDHVKQDSTITPVRKTVDLVKPDSTITPVRKTVEPIKPDSTITPVKKTVEPVKQCSVNTPVRKVSPVNKTGHRQQQTATLSSNSEHCVRLSANDLLMKRNAKGETSLQVAVIKGDYDHVESLLKEGCSPNVKDHAGWTPLHEACNHGNVGIAKLLLEYGANVDTPGYNNYTCLHDAVEAGHVECVRLLLTYGASLSSRTIYGKTPEQLCQIDSIRELLKNPPVPVNASNNPLSPLMNQSFSRKSIDGLPVVLYTGLTEKQKSVVDQCVKELRWTVVSNFNRNVTHVITSVNEDGACSRTLKYLQAILCGAWIVTFDWVQTCLEDGRRVEEEAFEVPGAGATPRSYAPQKGRLNKEQQMPGLLSQCHFYFRGDFKHPSPSRDSLMQLVQLGGGEVLHREPRIETICQLDSRVPYHVRPEGQLAHCSYYIICDTVTELNVVASILAIAPPEWLINCIANFTLID